MAELARDVLQRIRAGDAEGALGALEGRRAELGRDRTLTLAWMELLEAVPFRSTLVEEAQAALAGFAADRRVVVAACAALNAAAQLRPPDEPPREHDAASLAAEAAERALAADGDAPQDDRETVAYLWINRANALRHLGGANDEQALQAYRHALELKADRGAWWFDLGVLHKWRGRYEQAFDCFSKARALRGDDRPTTWNLAICATALGRGAEAAVLWRALGMAAAVSEKGAMPHVPGLPPVQVRVPTRGQGTGARSQVPDRAVTFELLWVAPLSPCHGVVQTPPFREAPVDYGDVVLWDGAPVGIGPDGTPRFALLTRLRPGNERKFRFVGLQRNQGDVERLTDALPEGVRTFIHRERVEHLCPRCASGEPARDHRHEPAEEHRIVYGTMVVRAEIDLADLRERYERAVREDGGVALALPGLYESLGDSKKAGQQHQAWRGIERTAVKRGLVGGPGTA